MADRSSDRAFRGALRRGNYPFEGEGPSVVKGWREPFNDAEGLGAEYAEVVEAEGAATAAERYAQGQVAIHAHLRVRSRDSDGHRCEVCAVAYKHPTEAEPIADDLAVSDSHDSPAELRIVGRDRRRRGVTESHVCEREGFVLVVIREPFEDRKRIVVRRVRSVYRLQLLESCEIARGDAPPHPSPSGLVPLLRGSGDGEGIRFSHGVHSEDDERAQEVVEAGAQLVENVACDDSPLTRRQGVDIEAEDSLVSTQASLLNDLCEELHHLRIEAGPDSAACVVEKGAGFAVERGQMFVCPHGNVSELQRETFRALAALSMHGLRRHRSDDTGESRHGRKPTR